MRVFTGHVHNGAIVPDGEVELTEGTAVTVVASGDDEGFDVTAAEEARLLESIAEADRGEVISPEALFERLAR